MAEVKLSYILCREGAKLPEKKHEGDAGLDIYAAEDVLAEAGKTVAVPTGLKLLIPRGYEIELRPRSGLSLHTRLRLSNSPATIDAGYRDEIRILITNSSPDAELFPELHFPIHDLSVKGSPLGHYRIRKGERICQMLLKKVEDFDWVSVENMDADKLTEDRCGGLGHSGLL